MKLRLALLMSCVLAAARAQDRVTAFTAARMLTAVGAPIDRGVMLVQSGKIKAIGTRDAVTVPPGAELVDLGDAWVWPGIVDLHNHIGGGGGGDINEMGHPVNPELRTLDVVRPAAEQIKRALSGGITTTLYIPGSGTFLGGFGALLKMRWNAPLEALVLRELGAMKVAQGFNPERRAGDLGLTRMGSHDLLFQTLQSGKDYAAAWRAFEKGTGPKPTLDPKLEQLRAVFDRKVPVLIHTAGARDIVATARMFQDVFDVRMILSHGCFDGWWAAETVARRKTPLNLGPRMYEFDRYSRFQGMCIAYWNAGCRDMSINTDAPVVSAEELPLQGAMANRLGLPYHVAVQALTIAPARQIGMGDRLGSLEPGKDADFCVSSGDPLDPRFPVLRVYIEGSQVYTHGDVK